jgi:hypothetical protein
MPTEFKARHNLGHTDMDVKIMLKVSKLKQLGRMWIGFICLRTHINSVMIFDVIEKARSCLFNEAIISF